MSKISKIHVTRVRTPRGEATERIVAALAEEFPRIHDRQSLLDSPALARRLGKKPGGLSPKEKRDAARTLGRLVSQGTVGEAIFLRSESDKVNLSGAGLVSISIDLIRLADDWKSWNENPKQLQDEPRQELTVLKIIEQTRHWIEGRYSDQIPLILLDISIVHGSNDFDLLLTILYETNDIFMKYVRDVVQRAPYVHKTHTMQIGTREGFPRLGRSAL